MWFLERAAPLSSRVHRVPHQIARAADELGFDAVLTPTGTTCEDAWLVTTALSQQTTRLRFLVAFRPGITNPWAEANRLLDTLDPALIDAAQQLLNKSESVRQQQRMVSLHGGSREDLEVSPNLWAGIGLVRPGAGTALVGSHQQVAERIFEYHDLGIDEFILSDHPHLEEAYAVGEGVLPLVTEDDPVGAGWRTGAPDTRRRSAQPATVR